jgi:prephenate dehydratase
MAISQSMAFLNRYPQITLIESDDTAGSAKQIRENNLLGIGTIASSIAAEIYELDILAEGIETYKKNYTRFLIIGSKSKGTWQGNKASVCFSLSHQPGSLASVLVKLAELEINLTKIQSVPSLNGGWEYMFYVDLELSQNSNIEVIENELFEFTTDLDVLGVYNKGDRIYES